MNTFLPLKGLKVIDITNIIMGPFTTQLLGDLGADVIKIEDPDGDITREIGVQKSSKMSSMYLGVNRNKRSIVLNLKEKRNKEVLWRLIKKSDFFIHNMRPQKLTKLGFDPVEINKINKKIIFVGLYGYGNNGYYSGQPAFDDIIQGQSGLAGLSLFKGKDPSFVPSVVADKSTGLLACSALLAAHIKMLKTGKGSCIEVSMFEGMVSYVLLEHQHGEIFYPPIGKAGYPRLLSNNRKPYKTADGHICILPYTDKQWFKFFEIIEMEHLKKDKRFLNVKSRSKDITVLYKLIERNVKNKTNAQLCKLLKKYDIPHGVVNNISNLKTDKHLKKVKFFRKIKHPTEGNLLIPDTGIKIDKQSLPIIRPQPNLGEHTNEVLKELGYNIKEINKIININKK
jgi:crotonobetainyl-CoA:carnitine CoA-transferase CaiB-like acyl-CoA transferase